MRKVQPERRKKSVFVFFEGERTKRVRTGEETTLEDTEEDTAHGELLPCLEPTHSEHDDSPKDGDSGELVAAADLTNGEVGEGLEEDVRDEEEAGDDTVEGEV